MLGRLAAALLEAGVACKEGTEGKEKRVDEVADDGWSADERETDDTWERRGCG